jgi:hypothetical protein
MKFDVYRGKKNSTLRMATLPGAGLPSHVSQNDWVLMPEGCACRKSHPDIFVMQSAHDWAANNTPCPLNSTR